MYTKLKFRHLLATVVSVLCLTTASKAQITYPAAYMLSSGAYSFTSWPASSPAGTYPANMIFYRLGTTADTHESDTIYQNYTAVYNATSQTRIDGDSLLGFSFLNTSTTTLNKLGAAILALNTSTQQNVTVTWTGRTITPNNQVYLIRMYYRVGDTGAFTPVLNTNNDTVQYVRSANTNDSAIEGPVTLPAAANNQQLVQICWKYFVSPTNTATGSRAELAVDNINVSSTTILSPVVNVTPTALPSFITYADSTSAADSFTVSGTSLTDSIVITTAAPFQISTSASGPYSDTLALFSANDTVNATQIYVRFQPTAVGTYNGIIAVNMNDSNYQNVTVTGHGITSVVDVTPSTLSLLTAYVDSTSAGMDTLMISGSSLTSDIDVSVAAPFEVSTSPNGTYSNSVTLMATNDSVASTPVYVRFRPTSAGDFNDNVVVSLNGTVFQNIPVTGHAIATSIAVTPNFLPSLYANVNSSSTSDSFTLSGTGLPSGIFVTASAPFMIATSVNGIFSDSVYITPAGDSLTATTLYVRFSPTSNGIFNGTIKIGMGDTVFHIIPVTGYTYNASNPAAFALISGNYNMNFWDSLAAAGTYPANMIFQTTNNATAPLTDAPMVNNWTCVYNLTNRPRILGLDSLGFAFINSGSPQYDSCNGTTTVLNTYMGASVLALNTMNVTNINLTYKAGLISQANGTIPRICNLRLQYRLDSVSDFTDMDTSLEYTSNGKVAGDIQSFSTTLAPAFNDIPYMQLRWLYYAVNVTGASGTRPEINIDDIMVTSVSNPISVANIYNTSSLTAYPNPVTAGQALAFNTNITGKMYDMFGRVIVGITNAKTISTSGIAAGIYTIITNNGDKLRVIIK